ncbi:MAG: hypothetical protein ACFFCZ_15080 [Promethearchaeota archaeon]
MKQQENVTSPFFTTASIPISLSLLVLVVTLIMNLNGFLGRIFDFPIDSISGAGDIFFIELLRELLLNLPFFILTLFLSLVVYKVTGNILNTEKKSKNTAIYTFIDTQG